MHGLFSSCGHWGSSLVAVHGLLIAVAALVGGAQALGCAGFSSLQLVGSVVGAHGLWNTDSALVHGVSCSVACGIFPGQRSNPCLLHWEVHSLPLSHRESPITLNFYFNFILMKSNSMGSFSFGFFFSTWF